MLIPAENIFKAQVVRSCKKGLIAMVATPQMVVDVLTQMMQQNQLMLDQMANMQLELQTVRQEVWAAKESVDAFLSLIEALANQQADALQPASGHGQPASSSGHLQQPLDGNSQPSSSMQLMGGSSQPPSAALALVQDSTPGDDEESDDGVDLSDPYWREWLAPDSVFSHKKGELYCNLCRKFDGAGHRGSAKHRQYQKVWEKYHDRL